VVLGNFLGSCCLDKILTWKIDDLGPMPDLYRRTKDEYHLPKGVSNRNKGLVINSFVVLDCYLLLILSNTWNYPCIYGHNTLYTYVSRLLYCEECKQMFCF
jgi:hypothetical protein